MRAMYFNNIRDGKGTKNKIKEERISKKSLMANGNARKTRNNNQT